MPSKALRTDGHLRFEYHLARELRMTHGELLHRMTAKEFSYWIGLYRIEIAEQQKAQRDAAGKSKARAAATRMRMKEAETY